MIDLPLDCIDGVIRDALARICEPELKITWPKEEVTVPYEPPTRYRESSEAWMA